MRRISRDGNYITLREITLTIECVSIEGSREMSDNFTYHYTAVLQNPGLGLDSDLITL